MNSSKGIHLINLTDRIDKNPSSFDIDSRDGENSFFFFFNYLLVDETSFDNDQ